METELPQQQPHPKDKRFQDITDDVYGMLTALYYAGKTKCGHSLWLFRCSCGNHHVTQPRAAIKSGDCGCQLGARISAGVTRHGCSEGSPAYKTWAGMIQRCTNKNQRSYKDYGGRGITVCERWLKFKNFYADMGERPSKEHSIDRIDVNGNYEPGNCRWATQAEQHANKTNNARWEFRGQVKCAFEWAAELGISIRTIRSRLRYGWTLEQALATPTSKIGAKNVKRLG